jgi:hypothetical protein
MKKALVLCWVLLGLTGCGEAGQVYAWNRIHDMIDVAHVDLIWNSYGVVANVGPVMVGYEAAFSDAFKDPDGHPAIMIGRVSSGIMDYACERGEAGGFLVPLSRLDTCRIGFVGGKKVVLLRPEGYGAKLPGWASVGLDVAVFGGVGAHVDVFELVDFVVGWFGVDISGDDASRLVPESAVSVPGGGASHQMMRLVSSRPAGRPLELTTPLSNASIKPSSDSVTPPTIPSSFKLTASPPRPSWLLGRVEVLSPGALRSVPAGTRAFPSIIAAAGQPLSSRAGNPPCPYLLSSEQLAPSAVIPFGRSPRARHTSRSGACRRVGTRLGFRKHAQ